jgi:hypothetical protein
MKVFRLMTLSLLLVSLFCFFAASASAGDATKQGSTQDLAAVEDPGNSGPPHNDDGSVGNPSHDDNWARKDKPSSGNWGSGNHPGQGGAIDAATAAFVWAIVTAL